MTDVRRLLSRREILGAGAGVGALTLARTAARADEGSARRVVVAGAGLAGLTAALDLVDAGWDVVVLEARDRVGGRVHTLRDLFSSGLHAEAGGESIDDNHDSIQALIRRFGLSTERRPPSKLINARVFYRGATSVLGAFLLGRGGKVVTDYLRFGNALGAFSANVDPSYPERAPHAEAIDAQSLEQFIQAQRLVPEAEFLVRLQNRGEFNTEPRNVSLLFAAQQANVVANVPITASETMRVSGGNSRLPEAMATSLGHRVRLGSPISGIDHHRSGVRVHLRRGPPIDAAWLVVAMPMNALRRVAFTPAIATSAATMIAGLDLGSAVKVVREYTAPFWAAEAYSGFTVTDLPFAIGWSPTDSYVSVPGLLSQFITGDTAIQAAGMAGASVFPTFQRQLDAVYPEGRPFLTERHAVMIWAHEQYTGGGYAVYRPGQMVPFWPVLRDGIGRIRFAGEHTEPLAGFMESAVRSGHRIARQLGRAPVVLVNRSGGG
ncbi:MAG: flavin monoamine oxidase family protein [Acidimicrobiales bacterium]